MEFLTGIAEEDFGYFVPDFEDRKLVEKLVIEVFERFIVLDAFLYKHHNFLVIIFDIIVFEYFTFGIVTQHF